MDVSSINSDVQTVYLSFQNVEVSKGACLETIYTATRGLDTLRVIDNSTNTCEMVLKHLVEVQYKTANGVSLFFSDNGFENELK